MLSLVCFFIYLKAYRLFFFKKIISLSFIFPYIQATCKNSANPKKACYEKPKSLKRKEAFDALTLYANAKNVPLLILGERGTGKTRLIESHIAPIKGIKRENIAYILSGSLTSQLGSSDLFGHKRGAFTGAIEDREGYLSKGRLIFFDEVQDLIKPIQRRLVRVIQEKVYRKLGEDKENSLEGREFVFASNKSLAILSDEEKGLDFRFI